MGLHFLPFPISTKDRCLYMKHGGLDPAAPQTPPMWTRGQEASQRVRQGGRHTYVQEGVTECRETCADEREHCVSGVGTDDSVPWRVSLCGDVWLCVTRTTCLEGPCVMVHLWGSGVW